MAKFSNAQVGDKVFSLTSGWGKIISTSVRFGENSKYPIAVAFDNGGKSTYTTDGKAYSVHEYPSLFWNPPVIHDPAPKRKIKKTTTRYVNLYKSRQGVIYPSHPYDTIEIAEKDWQNHASNLWLIKAQPVVFEWEEEE